MKGYNKIGQGSFSNVYRKGKENKVIIISKDNVKECMALEWFPKSRLFPDIERISINDDGTSTYTMKYFDKVTAPKKQLNDKAYRLYIELRKLSVYTANDNLLYEEWQKQFKSLSKEFKTAKTALLDAVDGLTVYGSDICFEVSPRNIAATKTGNLILLDCFFMRSSLKK